MKPLLLLLLAIPCVGDCPFTIKCEYHNVQMVTKSATEFRNGKQFGVYKHPYTDERGKMRECKLVLECK